jgi:GDPmannose 4,6-dehydratase
VSARVERAALITGVAGQDGVYLSRLLRAQGYRVTGSVSPGSVNRVRLAPYLSGVEIVEVDVCDVEAMWALLVDVGPDEIYNLAALSSVRSSAHDANRVRDVNERAVLQLVETLLGYREEFGTSPRLFQASSSEIFGAAEQQPQDERTPHRPQSVYAAAKTMAHDGVVEARQSRELFACNGILFNHESPLRPTSFVTRKITRAVAEISAGRRSELPLGNLDVHRDWGAAADHVLAMWLMLQQDEPDDYVIATGTTSSLRDVVELAFASVGVDDPWRYVRTDPALMRPADVRQTWGNPARANEVLGWVATTSLAEVIDAMVAVDVERIASGVEESPAYLEWPT